jgi:hypothetical protein
MARPIRIPRNPEETPPGGGARPSARPRIATGGTDELVELLALAELLHAHRRRRASGRRPLRRAA